jgi:hypothetical protein
MAWEWGPATINHGESVHWWFFWPEDRYPGIQVFQARTVYAEIGDLLAGFGANLKISDISFEWRPTEGYLYHLTVTHVGGWSPATYKIIGNQV